MEAYKIFKRDEEEKIVVVENETELELMENETAEFLCDVELGCHAGEQEYYLEDGDDIQYGDYILESGEVVGDESHSGQGETQGYIDVARTNALQESEGNCPFDEWLFDLWIGSYWNGSNWRVIAIER